MPADLDVFRPNRHFLFGRDNMSCATATERKFAKLAGKKHGRRVSRRLISEFGDPTSKSTPKTLTASPPARVIPLHYGLYHLLHR